MRVICWRHHHPGSRADLFARAMAAGAPGGELREVDGFAGPVPCDAAAIYGFSPRVRPIFEACRAAGVPVVLGDCGYWGAAKGRDLDTVGTIRISVDAAQPDAHWSRRPHPADRVDRPGLALDPPRRGGRHGVLSAIRAELAHELVMTLGLSLAQTARYLGVSTAAVSKILRKAQR